MVDQRQKAPGRSEWAVPGPDRRSLTKAIAGLGVPMAAADVFGLLVLVGIVALMARMGHDALYVRALDGPGRAAAGGCGAVRVEPAWVRPGRRRIGGLAADRGAAVRRRGRVRPRPARWDLHRAHLDRRRLARGPGARRVPAAPQR